MNETLVRKMIIKCFSQYRHEADSLHLSEKQFAEFHQKIVERKNEDPEADLYELIHDVVYEYLTN